MKRHMMVATHLRLARGHASSPPCTHEDYVLAAHHARAAIRHADGMLMSAVNDLRMRMRIRDRVRDPVAIGDDIAAIETLRNHLSINRWFRDGE